MTFDRYKDSFETIRMRREDGILEMTVHTGGDSLRWERKPHAELERAFLEIARDRDNHVVILTGTGEEFSGPAPEPAANLEEHQRSPVEWEELGRESNNLIMNMLAIDVPMIAAVNGPAKRHAELPVLCDIVLASETAAFQDSAHFVAGLVPGDGMHVVFPLIMGMNRGRYFLLTGQVIDARQALDFGLVNEVLPREKLLERAWEHAREIKKQPLLNIRYTRIVINEIIRKHMQDNLAYGLALEGLALVK